MITTIKYWMAVCSACYCFTVALVSCSEDLDSPVLPVAESVAIPSGTTLDANKLFGIWGGSTAYGTTNQNHFEQSYRIEFQSVDDGEAVLSHTYVDAESEIETTQSDVEYTYTFDGTTATLTPKAAYAVKGAKEFKAVHTGNNRLLLYTIHESRTDTICTIARLSDPIPSITAVDRTMPAVGETVTITGRNLQFVDHIYLPITNGEIEVTEVTYGSKEIKIVIPQADYMPGSIRCQSSGAHLSCYSPAYMFRNDCIFMKSFYEWGTKSATKYAGTEFEYTIKSLGTLRNSVSYLSSSKLPEGHSLLLATSGVQHPDSLLSFFGNKPSAWAVDTKTDPSKGYLRFSSGDRFQYVLDHCIGDLTDKTKCSDVAIQMDIYVYTDGEPKWTTGYFSYRMNKDQSSLTSAMVANVAGWEDTHTPMSFADGWKTFTIPLSAFPVTASATPTLGSLIAQLKNNNLQTIIKLVNYPLDALHPATPASEFQFSMANLRLVPYR